MGLIVQWLRVSGVTRDASGAPLGNCEVRLFETATNAFRGSTTSDASGNYGVGTPSVGAHFAASFGVDGSATPVAGITLDTLTGA